MTEDAEGYIDSVKIGGQDAWYMLGHAFWSEEYSSRFLRILREIYDQPETAGMLWEAIYMRHLDELKMKMRRYADNVIFEFDTLDELREFDTSYKNDTRSAIMKALAKKLGCAEAEMTQVTAFKDADNAAAGMRFAALGRRYEYRYDTKELTEI